MVTPWLDTIEILAAMRKNGPARKKGKPFPGLGKFVLVGHSEVYGWMAFSGANTEEAARRKLAEYGQYANRLVIPNEEPVKTEPESLGF
ncbi:hypothetical protein UFOVP1346_57 [uncultured Caudovirales phage]|uniref:Uncharacterized protein n=1 Tax=uncultured Caudovirales phage TaxID=2100421 RepID=A0A6J5S4H7_9CAUD|nr:hypothetical protein UFOVP921_37 [uncultured Caudovirales phage]CAB4187305.1 hypothetical protein UFOVP1156_13 [uncultured Caudovirales phage]CAB4200686.1 hypothetical protein UFOVP1346_57 [uncultured Caudovirales phage]